MSDSQESISPQRLSGIMFGFLTRAKIDSLEDAKATLVSTFGRKTGTEFAESIAEKWWEKREARQAKSPKGSGKKKARKRASSKKRGRGRPRKMGVRATEGTPRLKRGKLSAKCLTIQDVVDAKILLNFSRQQHCNLTQMIEMGRLAQKLGAEKAVLLLNALM
jgi:hypothetical protein